MTQELTREQLQKQLEAARETIMALSKRMHQIEGGANQSPFLQQLIAYQKRIRAEAERLKQSQAWANSLFQVSSDAMILLDKKRCIDCNEAALHLFGFDSRKVFLETHPFEFSPPRQPSGCRSLQEGIRKIVSAIETGSNHFEWVYRRMDGSEFPAEVWLSAIGSDSARLVMATVRDISERKLAEKALLDSHANLERLVEERTSDVRDIAMIIESTPSFVGMADSHGNIVYVNPAGLEMVGLERDAPVDGMKISDFHSLDESRRIIEEIFSKVVKEGTIQARCKFTHCDGSEIPASAVFMALSDGDGKSGKFAVVARDLRKEQELQHQMEHMDRLESLGVLAGGIAHDFNNILTAVIGNAGIAMRLLDNSSPVQKYLQKIEDSSLQAAELCKQMLAYSGKGKFVIQSVNLSNLVARMTSLLEVSIAKHATLQLQLSESLPAVDADSTQLQQILMNLVINASEAIDKYNGIIVISTGAMEVGKSDLQSSIHHPDTGPGYYAYIEVSDNGCGMDEEVMKKIFDPFFTTKFTGRGLGMSAVLGIVHGHNGLLQVNSDRGYGTTFRVAFPVSMSEPAYNIDEQKHEKVTGSGTVLVVDDERIVRELASMFLEDMGYHVLTANDGKEGVAVFCDHHKKITGVILDMTMPHMDGKECYAELCKIDPDVKVILSSGYNEEDATSGFIGENLAGFIQKPYQINVFQEYIARHFSKQKI